LQDIFDVLPDVVFFIKDREGRYTHVNLTLVRRLGMKSRTELIGKTALQVFPARLGGGYVVQDRRALGGEVIENQLELHLYANRAQGWCLTFKRPLTNGKGIVGLIGISRDLGMPDSRHSSFACLQRALEQLPIREASKLLQLLAQSICLGSVGLELRGVASEFLLAFLKHRIALLAERVP
jgi:hypothetical protein